MGDLSLGFNATNDPTAAAGGGSSAVSWSSPAARHINSGLPPEFFFVSPSPTTQPTTINFDYPSHSSTLNVFPLLTATVPSGNIEHHHHHQLQQQQFLDGGTSRAYVTKNPKPMIMSDDHHNLHHHQEVNASHISASTCQDCGNQAKKDCLHRRCRTCCKSRGYDCDTHVKSTWVPAARRRERSQLVVADHGDGDNNNNAASVNSQSASGHLKKPRLGNEASQTTTTTASHTSTSNTTPPRSFDTSSSHQDTSFKDSLPGQVRAPAVFKCVRVTSLEDGEDEYAYQAVVRIGGHVFKGFLYDQGLEGRDTLPNISELNLSGGGGGGDGGAGGGDIGGGRTGTSSLILDPSGMFGTTGGGGLLGGSSYGNPIN